MMNCFTLFLKLFIIFKKSENFDEISVKNNSVSRRIEEIKRRSERNENFVNG